MNTITTVFNFNSHAVRTVDRDGQPWFVAADVCAVLGIKNHRESIRHLDDDEKGVISNDTLGGAQQTSVVNESGLYALVLRSRKPEARKFAKWVTSEVLPAIRKTGRYEIPGTKKCLPGKLTASSQDLIKKAVRDRVESLPKEKWGSASVTIWSAIGTTFGTRGVKDGYKNIPDEALSEIMSLVARTPLSGEYIERDELTEDVINQAAIKALSDTKFALSFVLLENGQLMPQVFSHHKDAQTFVPAGIVREIRDRTFGFFPDDMIPDLISAISHRLRVAA